MKEDIETEHMMNSLYASVSPWVVKECLGSLKIKNRVPAKQAPGNTNRNQSMSPIIKTENVEKEKHLTETRHEETETWCLLQRQCRAFLESNLLPQSVQSLAQAVTVAWKGKELGIAPLQALSSITIINGKPCLSSELILALAYKNIPGMQVTYTTPPEKQNTECSVEIQRPGGKPQTFLFTIKDAERAGIYKNAWLKYPAAMLRARVISAAVRAVCPDAVLSCYTPEEMGQDEIIEAEYTEGSVVAPKLNGDPEELKNSLFTLATDADVSPVMLKNMCLAKFQKSYDHLNTHQLQSMIAHVMAYQENKGKNQVGGSETPH